jgi:DNA helicase-2/ATP-dependent DNA helicase PcrA
MGSAFARMHRGFENPSTVNGQRSTEKKPSYLPPTKPQQTVQHVPSKDFVPSDTTNLQEGQKVEHQKFGFGLVTKMEGSAHNPIATVKFEMNGEKKIMLNYAKLRIVE